jgi:NAD(P)-dependent dehydrogenase (short-subunit alcohol dehydrogenase family)
MWFSSDRQKKDTNKINKNTNKLQCVARANRQQGGAHPHRHDCGAIDTLAERSPLKRVAQPEEIAGLVSYLARDEARFVTGSSITIDGGLTL